MGNTKAAKKSRDRSYNDNKECQSLICAIYRKLKETEQLKQQVGEILIAWEKMIFFIIIDTEAVKKRKMENLALRTKKFLSKESEIQIFNDYIKKIVQRGEQVFCSGNWKFIHSWIKNNHFSGHHLLTDSCPACENCDLTIMRIWNISYNNIRAIKIKSQSRKI